MGLAMWFWASFLFSTSISSSTKWKPDNIYLKELLERLNEVISMKYLAECLKRKIGQ